MNAFGRALWGGQSRVRLRVALANPDGGLEPGPHALAVIAAS
jgi:hypothetical protein